MLTADACTGKGGTFLDADRSCDFGGGILFGPVPVGDFVGACPGACCAFASSACTDQFGRQTCEQSFQGEFQGQGTRCTNTEIACPSAHGACCVQFGGWGIAGPQALVSGADSTADAMKVRDAIGPLAARLSERHSAVSGGVPSNLCGDGITQFECVLFPAGLSDFHEGQTCAETQCPTAAILPGLLISPIFC